MPQVGQDFLRGVLVSCALGLAAAGASADTLQDSIESGRARRTFSVYIPEAVASGRRLPTVIALHGPQMTGKSMRTLFGMAPYAERDGFAIAYPDSRGQRWNDGAADGDYSPEDVHFIVQLAQYLIRNGIADEKRLYVVGIGSGGMLALRIACETPPLFAAFAAISADMPKSVARHCDPGRGIPMLIMNSRRSPMPGAAAQAEWEPQDVLSLDATVDFWRRKNDCQGTPQTKQLPDKDRADGSTVQAAQYQDCRTRAPVAAFTVDGGGYLPPGAQIRNRALLLAVLGRPNGDISAADVTWKFFRRFPEPE